ncbi:uncharacterized protein [Rutidosis leptorrhynchoides]
MYCLMQTYKMAGIVDDKFVGPNTSSQEMKDQYDSLLKGWILGSTSENVLGAVVDLSSAKDVWDKLKLFYDTTTTHQQAATKSEAKYRTEHIDAVIEESHKKGEDTLEIVTDSIIPESIVSTENKTEGEGAENVEETFTIASLRYATSIGDWARVESLLKEDKNLASAVLSSDGSTVLHLAVGIDHHDFVKNLLSYLNAEQVLEKRDSDGSTALHIAAIVGNTHAMDLLVKKNKALLQMKDLKGEEPLHKAYENMHLDTIGYLLKALDDVGAKCNEQSSDVHLGDEIGVKLLVNAISAKQYNIASDLIKRFPKFASKSDEVLMAIARTFPTGLDYWQTLTYPSYNLDDMKERAVDVIKYYLMNMCFLPVSIYQYIFQDDRSNNTWSKTLVVRLLLAVPMWLLSIFLLIPLCIIMVGLLFHLLYYILWKGINMLGRPTEHIENKKKEWNEATKVLESVCNEIDKLKFSSGTHHPYYTRPLLEAASQNAFKVVVQILYRSRKAIQSTDKSGYDIIQLAIIHRSEKVYNLIYDFGERKNLYRTVEDSFKNNILHLAGRLAPSRQLNRRRGAALQLQHELQWREEVKKHIFPTYTTRENIFKETPDMLFAREHENLLKEGENWMKTTSESCSITAALIATIMFAAAITVPGGNRQETGIPMFTNNVAFIIFAVSDAVSLFASSTALLVFLSILTARFAENDFLVSLPSRMLIGLVALLLSTITMMVAFSATLFLVFCHQKTWMLAPICVLAFIPIGFFVALQFPLMVDLFRSTYLPIFGSKHREIVYGRFEFEDFVGLCLYCFEKLYLTFAG